MKHILLPVFCAFLCLMPWRQSLADTADSRLASATYVDNRIAAAEERVVSKEELNTFSGQLPEQFVTTSSPQEISGTKTYTQSPIVPTPPLP
ncbi:MAG: hypothetical protein K2L95_02535 [Alphaproteobacteria bacterium]|nr:hypothetical protein [Alphaproteobacteria bacterium]MDE6571073.1 hypothetical protein [Alphaproteobacteria bacterium]